MPSRINAGSELVTPVNMYTEEHEKLLFPFRKDKIEFVQSVYKKG